MITRLIHTLFFLLIALPAWAQHDFVNYKQLTNADGLPSSYAFEMVEDKYGFIWIGTARGLVRYDGSEITLLEYDENDPVDLTDTYILSLLISGDSLWIGSRKGLSILNLQNRKISHEVLKFGPPEAPDDDENRLAVRDITQDRQGNLWLAPAFGGFLKWDRVKQTFFQYPLAPDETLPNIYTLDDQLSLLQIIQDVALDSIFWAASRTGLIKFNAETGEVTRLLFQDKTEDIQFDVNRKLCIYQDTDGTIYTGSWYAGLSIYEPPIGRYYLPALEDLEHFANRYEQSHLYAIASGDKGSLYLSFSDGLYQYWPADHSLQLLKKNSFKGKVIEFGIDMIDSGNRWWYSSNRGVTIVDPMVQQFKWYSLAELNPTIIEVLPRAIAEDFYPGYLSIAGQYTDGIYHIDPATGHAFKNAATGHMQTDPFFHAWGMCRLGENALLISENDGLYVHEKGRAEVVPYTLQVPAKYDFLTDILIDDHGTAWIGSNNDGLFSVDLHSRKVTSYSSQIPYMHILNLFQDKRANIWMTTRPGHLVYERKQKQFRVFDYDLDSIKTFKNSGNFCECPNGEIWASGYAEGIGRLSAEEPAKGLIEKVEIRNAAGETGYVARIACDGKNQLWGMSPDGLMKIDRENRSYQSFHNDYGLQDWSGMLRFLKDGKLFIGSRDGFYLVDPEQLSINTQPPKPYVTGIVTNKESKNKLEDHLNRLPVHLSANENVMTISFSSINHTLPERTKYLYMLEGLDEDWIDPEKKRSITYAYLPGGDYTFKLKAANNEGAWNTEVYELPIQVGTPWYKTIVFWTALAVLILGLAYAYYKSRILQLQKENQLKSTFEKRVANLEMQALRAQMNPHFIFNCMSSIESYVIRNDTRKASEYLNRFGRLVRLILQNSRNTYIVLQDELEALDLYIQLEQMRFRNSFSYEIILQQDLEPEHYEVPPMLIQPYVENAIWHGLNHRDEGGKVTIDIRREHGNLRCVIEDNGVGRAAATKMRAAQKIKRRSMGMGITAERIEIINKIYNTNNEVQIDDLYNEHQEATGTRVTINIPL